MAASRAWLLLLLLAAAPHAAAQGHTHEPTHGRVLVSPLGGLGTTTVGAASGFTVVALGADLEPDFHQDLPIRITLNGRVVFASDAESGHDYDGVATVWVVFGEPGQYLVEALDDEGGVAAMYEGTVQAEPDFRRFVHSTVAFPLAGGSIDAIFRFEDKEGPRARDGWGDIRLGDRLVSTATLHGSEGDAAWSFTPTGPGIYRAAVQDFDARPPSGRAPAPAVLDSTFDPGLQGVNVGPRPDAGNLAGLPALSPDVPPTDGNAVLTGTAAEGKVILGTYDPWTSVGTETLQHLAVLVLDEATRYPVADVAFTARIVNELGNVLWSSDDILEHDGIFEIASLQQTPGVYTLVAEATAGSWSGLLRLPWLVTPPAEAQQASAGTVTLSPTLPQTVRSGEAVTFRLDAADSAGQPFAHTEVVLDLVGPSPSKGFPPVTAIVLRAKLHTHDGNLEATLSFPAAGNYTILLTPSPLEARPVAHGGAPLSFAPLSFPVRVEPGVSAAPDSATGAPAGSQATPLPIALALGALAVALLARRSR